MKPGPKDPTRYTDWGDATLRIKKATPEPKLKPKEK